MALSSGSGCDMKRKLNLDDTSSKRVKQESEINPWTGQKYSKQYFDILAKRKDLPVHDQKDDFVKMLRENQVVVLQGETGSGKTTQVRNASLSFRFISPRIVNGGRHADNVMSRYSVHFNSS